MQPVHLKDLLEAGCHFGHKTERWHPKAERFIYQSRDGIHIIDLAKTKKNLEAAAEYLRDMAAQGKPALFVGTKRQAQGVVKETAERVDTPYLTHRWIGGFLTNWEQVHKNLERIRKLEEEQATNAWDKFPKHERVKLSRYLSKLKIIYGGVIELFELPKVLVLADIRKEKAAVKEARMRGITSIAIVDTNSDPTLVDFPIPANDDAVGSVAFIIKYLADAYAEGAAVYEKSEAKKAVEQKKIEEQTAKKSAPSQVAANVENSGPEKRSLRSEPREEKQKSAMKPKEESKAEKPDTVKETSKEKPKKIKSS